MKWRARLRGRVRQHATEDLPLGSLAAMLNHAIECDEAAAAVVVGVLGIRFPALREHTKMDCQAGSIRCGAARLVRMYSEGEEDDAEDW